MRGVESESGAGGRGHSEGADSADWPDVEGETAQAALEVPAHEVVDWRLRMFAVYEQVRTAATAREGHDVWRRERDALMGTHPASPLLLRDRLAFTGLRVAPYDPAYRFELPLSPEGAGQERPVRTGTDGVVPFVRLGTFEVPGIGQLAAWRHQGYGGGIFVPFRDATAGRGGPPSHGPRSYGSGRYLIDTIKGAFLGVVSGPPAQGEQAKAHDGAGPGPRFILDFNFAYNPSCAYNEAWACPLPGPENRVETAIPVGELSGGPA